VIFHQAHDVVTFFRPESVFIASPVGLGITTLIWGLLISTSYQIFGPAIKINKPWVKGLVFGLLVFIFFVWQQELFYYQFIEFKIGILLGAVLHMGTSFPIGCMLIGMIDNKINH
jgi:hypothetical protein